MRIAPREELPAAPRGDLLQAGPLLVREGRSLVVDGVDLEGFSAGRRQFDSDITRGRHPRAALGVGSGLVWAVACDGRSDEDAGMTLAELADYMVRLGVESAINLDGGGSTSLVLGGQLVNRPRDQHGAPAHGGGRSARRSPSSGMVRSPNDHERAGADREPVDMNEMNAPPKLATAVPPATLRSLDREPHRPRPARGPDDSPPLTRGECLLIDTLRRRRLHTRGDFLAAEQVAVRDELHELSRRAAAARRKLPPRGAASP